MNEAEQLKHDVREGRITPDRLVELVVALQRQLTEAQRRIEELEKKLGGAATVKLAEPFSLRAEEQRRRAQDKKSWKRKPLRRGRITTADKLKLATRTEQVYPVGVAECDCRLSHTRPVWRLQDGQAALVAYQIYRGPKNQFGKIPAALGRSEFGLEFILAIAYQVYVIGLSFDKVCAMMQFFQQLPLRKSQVDALLKQLSRHWAGEFDRLCVLLANSAVVHADETSWSLRSVWAFLSERVRLLFFGVHKDADTLQRILDPATFGGIVVSDDAAVYAHFTQSQKCWAHLLRKAIKLTLQAPDNADYRRLLDRLLEIYRAACRVQADRRLSDAGRQQKVVELDDQIVELCGPIWAAELPPATGPDDDYRLLCNELMRLMLAQQLFVFVTAAAVVMPNGETQPVAGTNNAAERALRDPAMARKTGRTNKTFSGCRRQTIIVSVLESLRQQTAQFTLSTLIDEILSWERTGRSCFATLLAQLNLGPPGHSVLDILLPLPSN